MRATIFAAKLSQIPFSTPHTNDSLWYYWLLGRCFETDIKIMIAFVSATSHIYANPN